MSSLTPLNDPSSSSSDSGLALPKLARSSDESASRPSDDNPAHFVDSLSEIMNLNLADYYKLNLNNQSKSAAAGSKTAHSDMDYYSSPSKSSSNEFSSPESSSKLNGAPSKYQSKEARLAYSQLNKSSDFGSFCDVDKEEDEEEDSNKHVTKLFVGNLPTSTTLPELLAVFKKFGPVNEKLSVVKDQNYAFIHFYHRKDAQVALREVNDSLFKDRYIRVQFSTSQGYTNNKSKSK
jgi:RNA recognition motif-containing protein